MKPANNQARRSMAINDAKEAEAAAVKKAEAKARKAKKKARRKAAQDTKEL